MHGKGRFAPAKESATFISFKHLQRRQGKSWPAPGRQRKYLHPDRFFYYLRGAGSAADNFRAVDSLGRVAGVNH